MGMIETLWAYISGKPSEVAKSSMGDAGAVKSPTKNLSVERTPNYCKGTLQIISRPRGATMSQLLRKTGKKKGSLSQEISTLRKFGYKILKSRKDSKSEYVYKVM